MSEDRVQVVVVGAGASGLVAAIAAAREGAQVTLLEGMKKAGSKLLMTGNGRCNMSTLDPALPEKYLSSDGREDACRAVFSALQQFTVEDTLRFFEEIGVAAAAQGALVYPRSGQAKTVLDALLAELERLRVKTKYNAKVQSLSRNPESGKWHIRTTDWEYAADRVVLCCGSKAAPSTGSDGSGYLLAKENGHRVTEIRPALSGLICSDPGIAAASGARTRGRIRIEDMPRAEETGEIQWTDYGISGIAAFQLSRHLTRRPGEHIPVGIDLVPDLTEEEVRASLEKMLRASGGKMSRKALLGAFTHSRVAAFYDRALGKEASAGYPAEALPERIAGILKHRTLTVTGVRGCEQAQVCAGGVALSEVNPETMESRLKKGLYFAGELLDADGPCGGYNLQWAWSSGFAAGKAAGRR